MTEPNRSSHPLDLSSFPLLRVDEVHLHDDDTLLKSEESITKLLSDISNENADDEADELDEDQDSDFISYVRKLAERIRSELAYRRIQSLLEDDQVFNNSGTDVATTNNNDECNGSDEYHHPPEACSSSDGIDNGTSPGNKLCSSSITTSSCPSSTQTSKGINGLNGTKCCSIENVKRLQPKKKTFRMKKKEGETSAAFVVIPSNSKHSNGSSFRERARRAKIMIKAKEWKSSDEYQKKAIEKEKLKRRQIAIDRIASRKAQKEKIALRQIRRKAQKLQREEQRKLQEAEVLREMELAAAEAKWKMVESGEVEMKGNVAAAIAAAQVMGDAKAYLDDSDSSSSIQSQIGEDSECSSYVCNEDNLSTLTGHQSLDGCELIGRNEEKQESQVRVVCDTISKTSPSGVNRYSQENTGEHGDKNEKEEGDEGQDKVAHPLSNHSKSSYESSKETCTHELEGASEGNGHFKNDPLFEQVSTTALVTVTPDDYCTHEVDWHPWLSTIGKDSIPNKSASIQQKTYVFTETYPFFHSIFTSFHHQSKSTFVRTDNIRYMERSCLEYQIKLHSALTDVYSDEKYCHSNEDIVHPDDVDTNYFRVSSWKPEVNSIISDVLLSMDFERVSWVETRDNQRVGNCWSLLWTWKKPKINPEHLLVCQKISRFQNTSSLTRKDRLKKKIHQYCANQKYSDMMPVTFVLPGEYNGFVTAFFAYDKLQHDKNVWIMKPVGMSRGRGISLINDIGDVSYSKPSVIQRYLSNPLLFHGFKFDLRLYVTVLSFSPKLEAFIYKEGFARFGSRIFSDEIDQISDLRIHLTNSSIQNDFSEDLSPSHPVKLAGLDGGGNKVKISWLWKRLDDLGISSIKLWARIRDLSLKTLLAVCDDIPPQPNSFELFGFDVLIDSSLTPWLIEVNACPSLARETALDSNVKNTLVEDTIKLVGPSKINRNALRNICERKLYQTKHSPRKNNSSKDILEKDLKHIFCGSLPRQYGNQSEKGTLYERLNGKKVT